MGGLLRCGVSDLCSCRTRSLKREDLFSFCFLQVRGRIQKTHSFVPWLFVESFSKLPMFLTQYNDLSVLGNNMKKIHMRFLSSQLFSIHWISASVSCFGDSVSYIFNLITFSLILSSFLFQIQAYFSYSLSFAVCFRGNSLIIQILKPPHQVTEGKQGTVAI